MRRFTVVVADDEPLALAMLGTLLRADPEIECVVECGSATDVRHTIDEVHADIVFLDVEMPEVDGVQIAGALSAENPVVVFVTAFSQYATQAFDVRAVDYLLKPFSDSRFHEALARAKERVRQRWLREGVAPAVPPASTGHRLPSGHVERLVFGAGDQSVVLRPDDVVWIEAQDYYVRIHTKQGRHLVRATLASLEARLNPARFVRVHRAAIVNLDAVQSLGDRRGLQLRMSDGTTIPVSRSRRRRVGTLLAPRERSA
jgi:two-component system LytT family response regulator